MRQRQRNFGALQRLGGHPMPQVRLNETREEIFCLCFRQRWRNQRSCRKKQRRRLRPRLWLPLIATVIERLLLRRFPANPSRSNRADAAAALRTLLRQLRQPAL